MLLNYINLNKKQNLYLKFYIFLIYVILFGNKVRIINDLCSNKDLTSWLL